ncbi:MAG: serine/threonine protein kinase, partial [Verrucomicrobiaceae bacterium]|nr:serine/threonine protein kinase [Verrucomicrobiaceae bacterium]
MPGSFGDYDLLSPIARGGMGIVYRARQRSLNREVALKMVLSGQFANAEEVRRFKAEAEAAARLDHPHIVPIYEVGEHQGRAWFSMRLVEGGTLAQKVMTAPGGKLAPREAAALLIKIARAVHYAHQRGLIHRDLKPANILLDAQGEPHITDFGLAKEIESDGHTMTGAVLGTPGYMAPEQAAGKVNELTTAVDVFALGAILYHLLTGRPPFEGNSSLEVLTNVMKCEPARPTTAGARIDRDLETIVLRCLEKEPAARFGSAEALADDLHRWLRGETILARRSTVMERTIKWARRKPAVAALGTAVMISAMAAIAVLAWSFDRAKADARRISDSQQETREQLRNALLSNARSRRASRAVGWREAGLGNLREAARIRADDDLRDEAIAHLAGLDWSADPDGRFTAFVRPSSDFQAFVRVGERRRLEFLDAEGRNTGQSVPADTFSPFTNIRKLVFDPTGRRFIGCMVSGPSGLSLFDAQRRVVIKSWPDAHLGGFSGDGRRFAISQLIGKTRIHEIVRAEDGTSEHRFEGIGLDDKNCCLDPGDGRMLAWMESTKLVIRDWTRGLDVRRIETGEPMKNLAWGGDCIAAAGDDLQGRVSVWNLRNGRKHATSAESV